MNRAVLLLTTSLAFAAPALGGQWVAPEPPKGTPAQPPAAATPTAPPSAECAKLKAELDALEKANPLARDDARTGDGARNDGGVRAAAPHPNQALKDARADYARRCGAPAADGKGAAAVTGAATVTAAPVAPRAAQPEPKLPKKAGPAMGTGSSPERCAQLHQSMKDSLARKAACAKNDNQCRAQAQNGYELQRNAYRSGCGDVPADAKPGKGKGR